MKKPQAGFTLIELIAVIVILGILAATALPRFLDTRAADKAAVDGVAGAFGAAIQMVRGQYLATADTDGDDIVGFGMGDVDVCTPENCWISGYPVDTTGNKNNATLSNERCLNVWNGILQNPPRAVAAAADTTTPGFDWNATWDSDSSVCKYSYRRGVPSGTPSTRYFIYHPVVGGIYVNNW